MPGPRLDKVCCSGTRIGPAHSWPVTRLEIEAQHNPPARESRPPQLVSNIVIFNPSEVVQFKKCGWTKKKRKQWPGSEGEGQNGQDQCQIKEAKLSDAYRVGPPNGCLGLSCRGKDRLPIGLALAKPYKPSSTFTPTKANASPETPTRRPRGRMPRRQGPGPNQRGLPVGCGHGGVGQLGARAWPRGGGLGLARVRVSRVRDLAQRETARTARTWPKSKGPPCWMPTGWCWPSASVRLAHGRRVRVS